MGGLVEQHEPHVLHFGLRGLDRRKRDPRGRLERVTVRAGRDRWKRDCPRAQFVGNLQRFAVARREHRRLIDRPVVNRSHCVNHPLRWQPPGRRRDGLPRRQPLRKAVAAKRAALLQNLWPTAAMDGAVDAAAAEQRRIRRVDDGIDSLLGDVAPKQCDSRHSLGSTIGIECLGCTA
jgi:hypothetical protein